jgi:predicted secreted protein
MKIGSMIAIYFVVWWTTLFAILPFGIRNAAEEGVKVEEGHDAGAPVAHGMVKKVGITTVVSAVLFAGIYYALSHGVLGG